MRTALALALVPAYLLGKHLLDFDPLPKEPKGAVKVALAFGLMSLSITFLLEIVMAAITGASLFSPAANPGFLEIFSSAGIEEVAKFLPFAIFVYKKSFFNELSDGIIYFAMIGLVFGGIETLLYITSSGNLLLGITRFIMALYFHAALTGLVGYVLAKQKLQNKSVIYTLLALVAATLVHTFYNFGLLREFSLNFFLMSVAIALVTNIALHVYYLKAVRFDTKKLA